MGEDEHSVTAGKAYNAEAYVATRSTNGYYKKDEKNRGALRT
jgi:hypothetical protein